MKEIQKNWLCAVACRFVYKWITKNNYFLANFVEIVKQIRLSGGRFQQFIGISCNKIFYLYFILVIQNRNQKYDNVTWTFDMLQ